MPEAMRNYLARLGWSHGNDELFTTKQALEWFGFEGMGKAPARLDPKKLDNVSAHHIKSADAAMLLTDLKNFIAEIEAPWDGAKDDQVEAALPLLREKSKTLQDVLAKTQFIFAQRPIEKDEKSAEILDSVSIGILKELTPTLPTDTWNATTLMEHAKSFGEARELGLGKIGMPLRAALSGSQFAPSAFGMMEVLGKEESLARIKDVIEFEE